eukprot:9499852-Pyramimonas_sp.AAC.2
MPQVEGSTSLGCQQRWLVGVFHLRARDRRRGRRRGIGIGIGFGGLGGLLGGKRAAAGVAKVASSCRGVRSSGRPQRLSEVRQRDVARGGTKCQALRTPRLSRTCALPCSSDEEACVREGGERETAR